MMVEFWTTKSQIGDKDENNMQDTRGFEKSGEPLVLLGVEDHVSLWIPAGSGLVPAESDIVNWLAHEIFKLPVSHHDFSHIFWSLSFLCTTQPSPKNKTLSHPFQTYFSIILSWHWVQDAPSIASSQDRQSAAPSQFLISWRMLYWTCCIAKIIC